jgi:hypothetical protein
MFSERRGFRPVRSAIQLDSIDEPLKNSLWNALLQNYFYILKIQDFYNNLKGYPLLLMEQVWKDFYKLRLDDIPQFTLQVLGELRTHFYNDDWYRVYDLIEFCLNIDSNDVHKSAFKTECNRVLERENSAYRFVGNEIAPITSETEIAEIEKATATADPIATHLKTALYHLANRESPDYRNSIKESISAVEAMCGIIAGKPKATLGDALDAIKKSGVIELHPSLNAAFDKLYGYTSDADGIRHAMLEESELKQEDAVFMLTACSAFVNYLKVKKSKIIE